MKDAMVARQGLQRVGVETLSALSDEELIEVMNGGHRRFTGALRKAIVRDARLAGAALIQLKSRHQHGSWGDWLKEHFQGSAETARLYMRVAKHWGLIEEQGLDKDGLTLEDLRWVLSESPGPRPGTRGDQQTAKPDGELELEVEATTEVGDNPPPTTPRQFPLYFSEDEREEFEEWVRELGQEFGTATATETVREAVRRCREGVARV